jgi:hypothetical protein
MPGSTWKVDPTADSAALAVLAAYDAAVRKAKPQVECYRAGVEAWVRTHPDRSVPMPHDRHSMSYLRPGCVNDGAKAGHCGGVKVGHLQRC